VTNCLTKELFDSLADARRKLAIRRYDYKHVGAIRRWEIERLHKRVGL